MDLVAWNYSYVIVFPHSMFISCDHEKYGHVGDLILIHLPCFIFKLHQFKWFRSHMGITVVLLHFLNYLFILCNG